MVNLYCEVDEIGYLVLLKVSVGGGGKGMCVVECFEDFFVVFVLC